MDKINRLVAEFAGDFARLVGDERFEVRLWLSQARSLITSARLVSDYDFAKGLFLRGVHLLERATQPAGVAP